MNVFQIVCWFMRGRFRDRVELTVENLAYRQQLAAYKRQTNRPWRAQNPVGTGPLGARSRGNDGQV